MKKRIFAVLVSLLLLAGLLPYAAMAEAADGYVLLSETERFSVYIKSDYPWTEGYNGYTSGNAESADQCISSLKIVAKTDGLLSFDWSVSVFSDFGYFAYRTSGDYSQPSDVTNQTEGKVTGVTEGKEEGIVVAQGDAVYFAYLSTFSYVDEDYDNTATVSNVAIADYVVDEPATELTGPVRYDGSDGTIRCELVTTSTNEQGGTVYTYTEAAFSEMTADNTYRVTATPNSGKQFYGWFRHYQYNGRTLVAYAPAVDGAVTFKMDDTTWFSPEFADENAYVARNGIKFYTEADGGVVTALSEAAKDSVVVLLKDETLTSDLEIPARRTLYVPFRDSWGTEESGGAYFYAPKSKSECSTAMQGESATYCRLTIPAGVTVTVNGTLAVGATLGYPSQRYQGHVSGPYGRVTNNGTIFVGGGGTFSSLGITDGSGLVYGDDGATVREPLIIGDFAGGNNSADLFFSNQMPFKRFAMQNIRCTLQMEAKANLNAMGNVWASSKNNAIDITLFGNTNMSAFRTNGAENTLALTRTYDGSKSLTDGSGLLDVTGVGLTHWSFSNSLTFQPLSISFGIKLDTGACDFVIPYNFDIELQSGTYTIPNSIKILPGAKLTIGQDATALISGRLFAVPGLVQTDMSTDRYPTKAELAAAGYNTCGRIIVDGKLIMQEGSTLGGVIESNGGGSIKLAETVYLENRAADLTALDVTKNLKEQDSSVYDAWASPSQTYTGVDNWVQQDGAKGTYDENTAWYNNPALIFDGESLVRPEAGRTYVAAALEEGVEVQDKFEGLYVPDGCYNNTDKYVTGSRYMYNGSYTFSRTLANTWAESAAASLAITSTVAGSGTSGSVTNGVTLEVLSRAEGTGTLITKITPVDANGTPKTEKYVFLVRYTDNGNSGGVTVTPTDDGWQIPAEANGVTIEATLLGDVTGDGTIKAGDYKKLKNYFLGKVTEAQLGELGKLAGDITGDGTLKAGDYKKLKNYFLGKVLSL